MPTSRAQEALLHQISVREHVTSSSLIISADRRLCSNQFPTVGISQKDVGRLYRAVHASQHCIDAIPAGQKW